MSPNMLCYLLAAVIELIWVILFHSGRTYTWHLTYRDGRMRLVYPMRYATWCTCNTILVSAVVTALRLDERSALHAVVAVFMSIAVTVPLELVVFGSPMWQGIIVFSYSAFLYSGWLVARGIMSALPKSRSRTQFVALIFLSAMIVVTWSSIPVFFHVVQYCAGDGPFSCLSIADEVWWWYILEGAAKSVFYAILFVTSDIMNTMDPLPEQSHVVTVENTFHSLQLASNSPWLTLVREHVVLVLGMTFGAAYVIFVVQKEFLLLLPDQVAAESHAYIAASVLTGLAAVGGLIAALEIAAKQTTDKLVFSQRMPADYAGGLRPDSFDSTIVWDDEPHVTVMFADLVGFTRAVMSVRDRPEAALNTVAHVFRHFDALHANAGFHKVETAGDAYISCIGALKAPGAAMVPLNPQTQARIAAELALSMIDAMSGHVWPSGLPVQVRIGIHCGPTLACVIGGTLPRWDVFGPTPILASRMEMHGAPMRVHVSTEFARSLGGLHIDSKELLNFDHEPFSAIERLPRVDIKGVGIIPTYWLVRNAHVEHIV